MRKLRTKIFLVMLTVNLLLAGGLYWFLTYSLQHAFSTYVSQRDKEFVETLASDLVTYYAANQGWGALAEDPRAWRTAMSRLRPMRTQPMRDGFDPPGPPPNRRGGPEPPFFLLDSNKNHLAGLSWDLAESFLTPLEVNGTKIGYLGMPTNPQLREAVDVQFAQDQRRNVTIVVVAIFVLALLAAIPLSQLLTRRISRLVDYVQGLSLGNYDASVEIGGKDELNLLGRHLSNLGQTLEKTEQQRHRWMADISHELRTPLAVLQAQLEAIEDGVRAPDSVTVSRLQHQVSRLKNLVDDFHALAITDSGSFNYRHAHCNVGEVLLETLEFIRPQIEKRGLSLTYNNAESGTLSVLGDSERLGQLFLNLLQNSCNYTDAPGQVEVEVKSANGFAIVTIADSAPGVDQALLPKLTERLFRVDASRSRSSGGAGLGLAICKNIAEAHGGRIEFSGSELGGLAAQVFIPLVKS